MTSGIAQLLGLLRTTGTPKNASKVLNFWKTAVNSTGAHIVHSSPKSTTVVKDKAGNFVGQFSKQAGRPHGFASQPSLPGAPRFFGTLLRTSLSDGRVTVRMEAGKAVGRRYQYTDSRGVTHFRPKGFKRAYQDPERGRKFLIIGATAGGLFFIYYRTHLEEVPYTHRKHFVAISPATERALGEEQFQQIKLQFADDILPDRHPLTRRVRKISSRIIEAAISGVEMPPANTRDEDGDLILESPPPDTDRIYKKKKPKPVPVPGDHESGFVESHRHDEELKGLDEELMDDKIHGAPDRGGGGGYTAHLNGLRWEVLVVDKDILNAFCLPGGKIVVFTGLIKHFPNDPEIATVLGHEVGHVNARHVAEKLSSGVFVTILEIGAVAAGIPYELIFPASQSLISLPNSRKMESEADKIGLILMAAAGYDPRVAPHFYEKMARLEGLPEYMQYLSTHPAGQARARALMQAKVMEEAIQIYERTLERETLEKSWFRPAVEF